MEERRLKLPSSPLSMDGCTRVGSVPFSLVVGSAFWPVASGEEESGRSEEIRPLSSSVIARSDVLSSVCLRLPRPAAHADPSVFYVQLGYRREYSGGTSDLRKR